MEKFLTKKDVCRLLDCSVTTLDSYMKNGLAYYKFGNKKQSIVKFRERDIVAFIENNKKIGGV